MTPNVVDQRNSEQFQNEDVSPEMQCITRSVAFTLKKSLKSPSSFLPLLSSNQTSNRRSYACEPPKQQLLTFPAFPLEETVAKWLKTTEPLLTPDELTEVKCSAEKFLKEDGPKLQQLLAKASKESSNWLADRWLKAAYLTYRDPVTVFSSPGMTFPHAIFKNDDEYLRYTSRVIYGMLKYKMLVDGHKIPIQKMGENELDNSQFYKVFGTCRIPGIEEDTLEYYPDSKHIAVVYRNHFYKVPVYSRNGTILHPDVIMEQLCQIMKNEKDDGIAFGILTSDNRDNWGKAYQELISIPGNEEKVCEIQESLFTVSLDQEVPVTAHNKNDVVSEQLIHGGGNCQNSGNRWFDKTIQVIVNRNGLNGFSYEHSPAEGQPIAMMDDYIVSTLNIKEVQEEVAKDNFEFATKLHLKSSPALDEMISTAGKNVNKLAANLHMKVLNYKGYGKEFLKTQKLSPDSFCQMAMQYAFYKMHKTPGVCYESAHLRIYQNGRTETIRSCSNESVAFCKAMTGNADDSLRVKLLRQAVDGHRKYTSMALKGRGVDRHLLGLKLMAIENGLPIPDFYSNPGIAKSSHFRLSTSQVASVNEAFMCYGPLVDNGYGCCYNPRKNDMYFAISSWKSNNETNSDKFAVSLTEALDSMMQVLCTAGEKQKAKL